VRTVLNELGTGQVRRAALPRRQSVPAGRQIGGDAHPGGVRAGWASTCTPTGWGSVTHWNAFVANLEMHGQGTFFDPRLDDPLQFPSRRAPDSGTCATIRRSALRRSSPALQFYQLSIPAPAPPRGSFDARRRARRKALQRQGELRSCHVPPIFTEPGWNMHTAEEIGIDDFQSSRSPDGRYRTTPLGGLFARRRAASTTTAASRRTATWSITTTASSRSASTEQEKSDLIEYLKSL
jgi:hypothetical protein